VFALLATQMPSTAEGFYWVTGAFTNETGSALFLILLSVLISANRPEAGGRTASQIPAACLLALAIAGTNETLLIVALFVLAGGLALQLHFRQAAWRLWCAVFATFCIGAVVAVLAPGNIARAGTLHHQPAILSAGAHSVLSAVQFIQKSAMSPALIAVTIFLVAAHRPHRAAFLIRTARLRSYSGIVLLLWLGLVSAAFFPAYLTTGILPPSRAMNTIYLVFLAGWLLLVLGIAEYVSERVSIPVARKAQLGWAAAVLPVSLLMTPNYLRAVQDLDGSAPSYAMQIDRRVDFFRLARGQHVTVPTLESLPRSISFDDVTYDRAHWRNLAVAEYYDLASIIRMRRASPRQ